MTNILPKPAMSIDFDIFEKIKNDSETESVSSDNNEMHYISDEEYNESYSFIQKREIKFKTKQKEANVVLFEKCNLILKEEEYLSE